MWKRVSQGWSDLQQAVTDKKNLPIVVGAAIGTVVLIGGAYLYFREHKVSQTTPEWVFEQIKLHRGSELKRILDALIREKDGSLFIPPPQVAHIQELAVDVAIHRIREVLKQIRTERRGGDSSSIEKNLGLLSTAFSSALSMVLGILRIKQSEFDLAVKDNLISNPELDYSGFKLLRVIHRYLPSVNNKVAFDLDLCVTSWNHLSSHQPEAVFSSDKEYYEKRSVLYDGLHTITKLEEEDLRKLTELYAHLEQVKVIKSQVHQAFH